MHYRTITLVLISVLMAGCATMTVTHISENVKINPKHRGLFYALPKNEFELVVTVETVSKDVSPYFKDVKGIPDLIKKLTYPFEVIDEKSIVHKVKAIDVSEIVIPDKDKRFFIRLKGYNNPFISKKYSFKETVEGLLTESQVVSENNAPSYIMSAAEGISPWILAFNDIKQTEKMAFEAPTSPAEAVIAQINELQESKYELLSLKHSDLKDIEITASINHIKKEIEHLTSLISGTKTTKSNTYTMRVKPTAGNVPVFKLVDGIPTAVNKLEVGEYFELAVNGITSFSPTDNHYTAKTVGHVNYPKNKGIYYAIPATVEVSISSVSGGKTKVYYRKQHCIPQLGDIAFLPNRVGLINNDIKTTLDAKTGALLQFEGNAKELDPEKTNGFIDSMSEKWTPAFEKKTPASEEETYLKALEYELKVKEMQVKLDSLNNVSFD